MTGLMTLLSQVYRWQRWRRFRFIDFHHKGTKVTKPALPQAREKLCVLYALVVQKILR